jgi:hypothetical protein
MHVRHVVSLVAAFAAGALVFGLSARAEDPAMPSEKKIEHPLLKGVVGDWNVSWTATSQEGTQSGKATSTFRLAAGDTILVEDYSGPEMMGGFYGHGVIKLSADGKTMTTWWFDSMGPEPLKLSGPVTDTTTTIEADAPQMGHIKIVWKKVDGGFDFDGTLNGNPWLKQEYRKK